MSICAINDTSNGAVYINRLITDALFVFTNDNITAYNINGPSVINVTVLVEDATVHITIDDVILIDPLTGDQYTKHFSVISVPINSIATKQIENSSIVFNTCEPEEGTFTAELNRCCCMLDFVPERVDTIVVNTVSPVSVQVADDNTVIFTAIPPTVTIETTNNTGITAINGVRPVNGNIDLTGTGIINIDVSNAQVE